MSPDSTPPSTRNRTRLPLQPCYVCAAHFGGLSRARRVSTGAARPPFSSRSRRAAARRRSTWTSST
eukprot:6359413-Prymnesium_polylepis.1